MKSVELIDVSYVPSVAKIKTSRMHAKEIVGPLICICSLYITSFCSLFAPMVGLSDQTNCQVTPCRA